MRTFTLSQARRMALGAQGFADPLPGGRVDVRHLRRVLGRTRAMQIDSVNVVARAHELLLFSRLGAYSSDVLHDAAYRKRELIEYWAHEAAFIPTAYQPLFRWRMAAYRDRPHRKEMESEHPGYLDAVLAEVAANGPLAPSELQDPGERSGPWWGWAKGKRALELLFAGGEIAVAERTNFARQYDLTERVVPPHVLAEPTPSKEDAWRDLLLIAAQAHGMGTTADLCDYFRLKPRYAGGLLDELVTAGQLEKAHVGGVSQPVYVDPDATVPRRIPRCALLSPFDPVIWFRPRAQWLFDFHYRIEIYTPAAKRVYGYYVFAFLQGERITARVDLKADRTRSTLRVQGAFAEDHADPRMVTGDLAAELARMAGWLGLTDIVVEPNGDLARALTAQVANGDAGVRAPGR